ncbi:hypothetical protein PKOR_22290 [Pontibacter korlensis]|uniref:Uncharacterized protein n=1 Tax=Pontibacter korlensis TaxID=400092 RepID=A0A0E3UYN3_9BACT|nr:hypothetical protein [Pontibacter korlensis]AKD05292.1 hypothetical protein PKOR_22290 [Pontibacter korlensis]
MGQRQNQYTQNFDELPASETAVWESGSYYLPGWSVYRSVSNNIITANNGSGNTGRLISYGSTGSTDRALGSIASAKAGELLYMLLLQNNTGSTIKSVELTFPPLKQVGFLGYLATATVYLPS